MLSFLPVVILSLLLLIVSISGTSHNYCIPENTTCWPSKEAWNTLNSTVNGHLLILSEPSCKLRNTPFEIADDPSCMQAPNCAHVECNTDYVSSIFTTIIYKI